MYVLAGAKPKVLTASGTAIWRRDSLARKKGNESQRCPLHCFMSILLLHYLFLFHFPAMPASFSVFFSASCICFYVIIVCFSNICGIRKLPAMFRPLYVIIFPICVLLHFLCFPDTSFLFPFFLCHYYSSAVLSLRSVLFFCPSFLFFYFSFLCHYYQP